MRPNLIIKPKPNSIMRSSTIFCTAVSLAILIVILLSLLSPIPSSTTPSTPWISLSLYIQQPLNLSKSTARSVEPPPDVGALIFHHNLTEGPESTSRVVGKAQGFVIPVEHFAHSAFNIIYLTFDTPQYSGSLSVQANHLEHKDEAELSVVGGTGSFAFARGLAVLAQTHSSQQQQQQQQQQRSLDHDVDASTYLVKLQLNFPNHSHIIPG